MTEVKPEMWTITVPFLYYEKDGEEYFSNLNNVSLGFVELTMFPSQPTLVAPKEFATGQ